MSDASGWEDWGISLDDAPRWVAVGISDPESASDWDGYSFSPEDASRWVAAGFLDADEAVGWRDDGFTPADAAEWAVSWPFDSDDPESDAESFYSEEAADWRAQGFTVDEAREWKATFVEPDTAARLVAAGFKASDCDEVDPHGAEEAYQSALDAGARNDEARSWAKAGVEASEIQSWRDAGFTAAETETLSELGYDAIEARRETERAENVIGSFANTVLELTAAQDEASRHRLRSLMARSVGTVANGDGDARLKIAINRSMEQLEPKLGHVGAFLNQFPPPKRSGYRMASYAGRFVLGLTDSEIVGHAWHAAKEFVHPSPWPWPLSEDNTSAPNMCFDIAKDLRSRSGRYKPLRKDRGASTEVERISTLVTAIGWLGLAAETRSASYAVVALQLPSTRETFFESALSVLDEMIRGELRRSSDE